MESPVDPTVSTPGRLRKDDESDLCEAFSRHRALERLQHEKFDVLVIGGGVTGAGVALDAACRGLKTALVEKDDFASGTSSKSSKMVHGGLRYLQQRELRLVYENLAERQRLLDNAAHLVKPLPFLIPLFGRSGVVSKTLSRSYATALWLYDVTGGLRIGSRHRRISKREALAHMPVLDPGRLVSGFLYYDARADDARLTLAILRTAALRYRASAINYAQVTELCFNSSGKICGARVLPRRVPGCASEPSEIQVDARVVVNATGVWADDIRALDEGVHPHSIRPAKGSHITVAYEKLPCDVAAVIPVAADHRSIFVVPWPEAGLVYIGTTDTDYSGPLDSPLCTPEDVDYLLNAVNSTTTASLNRADITGVWAGLRPLLAPPNNGRHLTERTADLSRRHTVRTSKNGLVTVTGGKLTTYRKMAEDAVNAATKVLDVHSPTRSVTKKLRLIGADGCANKSDSAERSNTIGGELSHVSAPSTSHDVARSATEHLSPEVISHLESRYGQESASVLKIADGRRELLNPLIDGLAYLGVEVVFAARFEMAIHLCDVLDRRTRASLQDAKKTIETAYDVAELMAPELGWSKDQTIDEARRYIEATRDQLAASGIVFDDDSRLP